MSKRYDAIIIGTGQSGPSLAHRLSATGMTIAVAERHLFGGTCVNTGCMPTKTLVASAYAAHLARRSADYGIVLPGAIEIESFSFGAENTVTIGSATGGAGVGKARFQEFTVEKAVDSTTPRLLKSLAMGTHFATVELIARKPGGVARASSFGGPTWSRWRRRLRDGAVHLGGFDLRWKIRRVGVRRGAGRP